MQQLTANLYSSKRENVVGKFGQRSFDEQNVGAFFGEFLPCPPKRGRITSKLYLFCLFSTCTLMGLLIPHGSKCIELPINSQRMGSLGLLSSPWKSGFAKQVHKTWYLLKVIRLAELSLISSLHLKEGASTIRTEVQMQSSEKKNIQNARFQ